MRNNLRIIVPVLSLLTSTYTQAQTIPLPVFTVTATPGPATDFIPPDLSGLSKEEAAQVIEELEQKAYDEWGAREGFLPRRPPRSKEWYQKNIGTDGTPVPPPDKYYGPGVYTAHGDKIILSEDTPIPETFEDGTPIPEN
jgi:hypothetical protein